MIKVGCCGFAVAKEEYYSKFPKEGYCMFNNASMLEDAIAFKDMQKRLAFDIQGR